MRLRTRAISIGNQSAWYAGSPAEPFAYAVANAFDAFEWFPDKQPSGAGWEAQDLTPAARSQIRRTAREQGIRLSVHGRWQANPLQPEALSLLLQDLQLAEDLGASLLNIHLYTEAGLPAYVKAIQPLIEAAATAGLRLSIENSPANTPEHFNELFRLLRQHPSLPRPQVGMCFDLGHANLCPATRNDYVQYLTQLEPAIPIIHLHLHENWGDRDSHLPLFTGPAGQNESGLRSLIRRIKARHYAGSIILEGWPTPPTLLNQAREKLLTLLEE